MSDIIYMLVGLLLCVLVLSAVFVVMVLERLRNRCDCCGCDHYCGGN